MNMNKTVEELKTEIEVTRETQPEEILKMEILGKSTEYTNINISNRI